MKSNSDLLKTSVARTKKIFWILGLHAFYLILFLIFIDFAIGGFIIYEYVFLAEKEMPSVAGNILTFDTASYQRVLEELQARGADNATSLSSGQSNPSK